MNDKNYMYSIKWTQPYPYTKDPVKDELIDMLIETYLEQGWFEDANKELKRVMSL